MELKIEDGVSEIPAETYAGKADIESVFIPSSVVKIGARAFRGCVNLHDLAIEDGSRPLEIGERAFEGCQALQTVELPGRASRFLNGCFKDSGLKSLSIGRNGDYIAKDFRLFEGCPAADLLGEILEEERQSRAEPLHRHARRREHSFPVTNLTRELQGWEARCEGALGTALQSLYRHMVDDEDFDIKGYGDRYKNACDEFAQVRDWANVDAGRIRMLVSGTLARNVANIDFGEIWDWEWDTAAVTGMREICASVQRRDFNEDALRTRFYRAFTRIRHHAAFHRLMALAHPDGLVQIPAIAAIVPLYSWFTRREPPTVEQARWYELSHAVRSALSEMLPSVDVFRAGVFAWYLANAFRDNPKGDDVRRRNKIYGWMRELGLIRRGM